VVKETPPTKLLMLVSVIVVLPDAPKFKLPGIDETEKSETT
jgi:hypothetical protein